MAEIQTVKGSAKHEEAKEEYSRPGTVSLMNLNLLHAEFWAQCSSQALSSKGCEPRSSSTYKEMHDCLLLSPL